MALLLRLLLRFRIPLLAALLLAFWRTGWWDPVAAFLLSCWRVLSMVLWAGWWYSVAVFQLLDWGLLWGVLWGVLWPLLALITLLALARQFGLFWLLGFFGATAFLSFHAYRAAACDDLVTLIATGVVLPVLVVYFFFKWTAPLGPQRRGVVHIRDRETRRLDYRTEPAAEHAERFWPYAVLSEASYHDWCGAKQCVDEDRLSWQLRHEKPPSQLRWFRRTRKEEDAVKGLHYQIWLEPTQATFAVVFRGTRPTRLSDWIANLHWVLGLRDHYTNIEGFIAKLIAERIEKIAAEEKLPGYELVCAGHSLGGGLARQLAFCYPGERCTSIEVYGFDASAVDGRLWLKRENRVRADHKELTIHDVFERGEVLSLLRNLRAYVSRRRKRRSPVSRLRRLLSAVNPFRRVRSYFSKPERSISSYRFNYSRSANPVASHSMADLASELRQIADEDVPTLYIGSAAKRLQLQLIYDYIKFHIAMYMATPVLLTVFAYGFKKHDSWEFLIGLVIMVLIFAAAGMHASFFMGAHVNRRWHTDYLREFEASAFSTRRRFLHHWMYWAGLLAGVAGFLLSLVPVQGGS